MQSKAIQAVARAHKAQLRPYTQLLAAVSEKSLNAHIGHCKSIALKETGGAAHTATPKYEVFTAQNRYKH